MSAAVKQTHRAKTDKKPVETKDCLIAYDKIKFKLIGSAITPGNALFVDLIHSPTNQCIRVVSDHVQGFNSQACLNDPELMKNYAAAGDEDLINSVYSVDQVANGIYQKFLTNIPISVIYCLDSNTTKDNTLHTLHPDRLKILEENGFVTDVTDVNPTIMDASLNLPFKFDYIFAKNASVTNVDLIFENSLKELSTIKGEKGINFMSLHMSDHLPIISRIEINK